jgi:hypothetical protein
LFQITISKIEKKKELVILINIGYPSPEITRETMLEILKKFADLIFISLCSRENNYGFAEVERRACCRFIVSKDVIFGDLSWEFLGKEIPL